MADCDRLRLAALLAIAMGGCYPDDLLASREAGAITSSVSDANDGAPQTPEASDTADAGCGSLVPSHPSSCYDLKRDGSETDIDCGGGECQPCTVGDCVSDSDCLLGSCSANVCGSRFELEYLAFQEQPLTAKIDNRITLLYATGSDVVDLKSLSLRYYFKRNGVAEPLTTPNVTSTLLQPSAGTDISTETSWQILRTTDGSGGDFDAFLQIRFTQSHPLLPGDVVKVDQNMNAGNDAKQFDQRTHYSFRAGGTLSRSDRITVYQDGRLVWGYEPRGASKISCFSRGIDFNGPALTIGDEGWSAAPAALTSSGGAFDESALLYPKVDGPLVQVIQSGYRLSAADYVRFPAIEGDYLAYVYAFSAGGLGVGTLSLQGLDVDDFQSGEIGGGQTWGRLGPYRITVGSSGVELGCTTGSLALSAIELRVPADASY